MLVRYRSLISNPLTQSPVVRTHGVDVAFTHIVCK